jgi:hypothetical protein
VPVWNPFLLHSINEPQRPSAIGSEPMRNLQYQYEFLARIEKSLSLFVSGLFSFLALAHQQAHHIRKLYTGTTFRYDYSHCPFLLADTERRGRVVNSPASYSEGPGFKSRPRRPVMQIEVSRGFPQSLQTNSGLCLKLGHDRFLPNPFPFIIIRLLACHRRCIV